MKILMVSPEVAPFARATDLGDVGGALPKMLKEMGHDIRVITPQYQVTNERRYILRDVIRLQDIKVPLGEKTYNINVKSAFIPGSKVQVYFIDYKPFFFREGLYSNPKSGKPYADNDARFILFAKGVLKTLTKLQWQPDVIHCHNWQSGCIPLFLKQLYSEDPFFQNTYSLFTVHDFASQGIFDKTCASILGEDGDIISSEALLEKDGSCNFLKTGLHFADIVNTVSDVYAKKIQADPKHAFGTESLLKKIRKNFFAIRHGIDDALWDPEKDPYIENHYSASDLTGKEATREVLMERVGLEKKNSGPLISVFIESLADTAAVEKGMEEALKLDYLVVVTGAGAKKLESRLKKLKKTYANRLGYEAGNEVSLQHLVIAGSDFILNLEKAPNGMLLPLYSLQYGTPPILDLGSAASDVVQDFDAGTGKGNGFILESNSAAGFQKMFKRIKTVFSDEKTRMKLIKNAMREDVSWRGPAKKYIQLYQKCMTGKA